MSFPEPSLVPTAQGRIAVHDNGVDGPAVVLLHGNSTCSQVFEHQFDAPFARRYRLVALDLPGHSASDDAADPDTGYTMPGYAEILLEAITAHGIERAIVFGWSLGGHIAIEFLPRWPGLVALSFVGTPAVRPGAETIGLGFPATPHVGLSGQEVFNDAEAEAYARRTCGQAGFAPFLVDAVRRTDGRARRIMMGSAIAGIGLDEREAVAGSPVPLGVFTGEHDEFVNGDYITGLTYARLWRGRVQVLDGLGHAPFREAPQVWNPLFEAFLDDVTAGRI